MVHVIGLASQLTQEPVIQGRGQQFIDKSRDGLTA